jgi:hypothetical protein
MSKLRARRPVDQQAADSFVSAAERPPEPPSQRRPEPVESVARTEVHVPPQPISRVETPIPPPVSDSLPWEGLPENANRPFQLRLPAPVYAKLQWAAERAGKSMHKIALEAVRQAVEREVRKHLG